MHFLFVNQGMNSKGDEYWPGNCGVKPGPAWFSRAEVQLHHVGITCRMILDTWSCALYLLYSLAMKHNDLSTGLWWMSGVHSRPGCYVAQGEANCHQDLSDSKPTDLITASYRYTKGGSDGDLGKEVLLIKTPSKMYRTLPKEPSTMSTWRKINYIPKH